MSDLISRQAVTNCFKKWQPYMATRLYDFEQELFELPSVQPKQKWIPVSERLPEDGHSVLFCDIDNDIMVGYHVKGRSDTHFSQDGTYEDMKNVVAWMPLPEPYKAESEDKE